MSPSNRPTVHPSFYSVTRKDAGIKNDCPLRGSGKEGVNSWVPCRVFWVYIGVYLYSLAFSYGVLNHHTRYEDVYNRLGSWHWIDKYTILNLPQPRCVWQEDKGSGIITIILSEYPYQIQGTGLLIYRIQSPSQVVSHSIPITWVIDIRYCMQTSLVVPHDCAPSPLFAPLGRD